MIDRIRNFLRSESEKLEGRPLREKLEYIRDYYWLWILSFVSIVSLVSFVSYRALTTPKDHWFYLTLANTRAELGNGSELWDGYVKYTGYDLKQKLVDFNSDSYFDYGKNHAAGNRYYEIFVSLTDAGVMDAVTMEPDNLKSLGESGRLLDLNSDKCASIRQKYGDRFLYAIPLDKEYSEDPVPVGIDISDSILMKDYQIYADGCALGICAYSGNLDAVEKFLDYVLTD